MYEPPSSQAAKLIRQHGVFGLGGYDGCLCTSFMVHHAHVDISCRKSSGTASFHGTTIRVWSDSLDYGAADLVPIAEAVIESVKDSGETTPMRLRFCDYTRDKEAKCVFCHAPRAHEDDYLCAKCSTGNDAFGDPIRARHDYESVAALLADKLTTADAE